MNLVLSARDVSFAYPGPLVALDSVTFGIEARSLAVLIGPNGSGKSTLLKLLGGTLTAERGEVLLEGRPLAELAPRERARAIAMLPQFLPALPEVLVRDFVLTGRYAWIGRFGAASAADRAAVERALDECDAAELGARSMAELSGGQRQRVIVARALAQDARVLLIDEPTHGLDPEHQIRVFELIARLRENGRTALVVTHDLNLAAQYATHVSLLDRGRIVAQGSVGEMLRPEVLAPVYGRHLFYGQHVDVTGARRPFVVPWSGGS